MAKVYWIAVVVMVGLLLWMFYTAPVHAADSCKITVQQAEKSVPADSQWTLYAGIPGARLIGWLYAQQQIPGYPPADRIMTNDGPGGTSAVLMVLGNCVTYALPIPTDALKEIVSRIIGTDS